MLFHNDMDDVPFTVLDVETTGMNAQHERIIEFAGFRVVRGEIVDSFSSFFNPHRRLDPFITMLTGIKDEDLIDAPVFDVMASKLMDFLQDSIIVGHNIQFDVKFLASEFVNAGYEEFKPVTFCTLRAAKRLFPQLKSKRLEMVR
ncbi:MAG: 3'-5' exonuclease, partial [Ignavibacteriaceae bacterium]|nr:3'-5' exonuclease [Ignavibacteriaceae bacterium]